MNDWGYICIENNRVEQIPNDIVVTEHADLIRVRMPDVIYEELEKIVAYKEGISVEQVFQRFVAWCVEEPESFAAWCRNAGTINDDYE